MTPQSYCHRVCKESGSNFVYTFYLFGKKRRQALEAFYAFCRKVDDAVDQAGPQEKALQGIQYWKEEVKRIYEKRPEHPVGKALTSVVKEYQIPQIYLNEIIAGCEMDLYKKTYATFEELETYCYKVASCVGLVCLRLFGVRIDGQIETAATALGKALQLTNILRDVVTDLRRERVYLPQEDLKHFSVSIEELAKPSPKNLNLLDLLYFEMGRAEAFYKLAWGLFPVAKKERRKMLAALLMGRFYEEILGKISKDPFQIFETKVSLTGKEKLKIALQELFSSL